jgi:hypothetical protein
MLTSTLETMNGFFESTKNIIYFMFLGFILILVTFGTSIKNSGFLTLIMKIAIVGIYLYAFNIIYNSLKNIFDLNGLFMNPSMSKMRNFFLLYVLFDFFIIMLVLYILYTILF